ncbi:hypothetical protein AB0K43_20780 [Kitasatospora sp. NPDC049258]|uniref:hypothetical protein n=1 Tax=Kitasatospora sp. NPDC049258 TaxID=3155394 RepID=UPI003429EB88
MAGLARVAAVTAARRPRLLATQGADGTVGWTLSAANGRRLACSARPYRAEEELLSSLRELLVERAALRYQLAQGGPHLWVWTACLPVRSTRPGAEGPEPIARSARGYLRRDQCRQGIESFRAALQQLEYGLRLPGPPDRWPW